MAFKDRFLRVTFANDALTRLSPHEITPEAEERFKRILTDGLDLCNRKFVFLGYSSSQLREHAVWVYCEENRHLDNAPTADTIRKAAGELSSIKVPPKYAARLAQCFSTTYKTLQLQKHEAMQLAEMIAPSGEMFSDGVGVITRGGMEKVVRALPIKQHIRSLGHDIAAVQVRLGGCKGVLACWDVAYDPTTRMDVPGEVLVGIRPSMKKFDTSTLDVEVCNLSKAITCNVNRQIIIALMSLGVPGAVFWDMYEEHVRQLDLLLEGGDRGVAVLSTMGSVSPSSRTELHVSASSLAATMMSAGFNPREDPFLMSLVQAHRAHSLKGLQDRCRMPVEKGITLMGIIDETGTVPAGTFWAAWDSDRLNRGLSVANAAGLPPGTRCVVSRSPCMSPTDIRILTAADPADLSPHVTEMKNVLVFSRNGVRPDCCMMSGGDLDGDIYFIIYDQKLLPTHDLPGNNYAPASSPEEVPEVCAGHIVDFFVNFMKNDQLGRIANLHLAAADGSESLARDPVCEQLCMLHSVAVDFPKTGIPVSSDAVRDLAKGVEYPDFLVEKGRVSETVVGRIFRDARERVHQQEALQGRQQRHSPEHIDPCLVVRGSEDYLEWAYDVIEDWVDLLSDIMYRYGAHDVGEVMTGHVRKFHGISASREKNADHQQRLNRELSYRAGELREYCFPEVQGADTRSVTDTITTGWRGASTAAKTAAAPSHYDHSYREQVFDEALCKASALYQVAYSGAFDDGRHGYEMKLAAMAGPWYLAARLLAGCKGAANGHWL